MYDLLRKNERKTPAHRQLAKHFTNQTPNLPSPADYTRALFIVEGPPSLDPRALRHIHPSKMQASLPPPPNTSNTEIEFWDRFGFLWRLSTSPHIKKCVTTTAHSTSIGKGIGRECRRTNARPPFRSNPIAEG